MRTDNESVRLVREFYTPPERKNRLVTGTTFPLFMNNLKRFLEADYVLITDYGLTEDGSYFAEVRKATS